MVGLNNFLFCDQKIYDKVKQFLDRDLGMEGNYMVISMSDGMAKPEDIFRWTKNQGYLCIATYHPEIYSKMFPNNVVDAHTHDNEPLKLAKEIKYCLTNFGMDKPMTNNTFFISDTHFFHNNIISYCNRPFRNVDEMNSVMIENWNNIVREDDVVWHLGDFSFGKKDNVKDILPKLNGKINLIVGNHDKQNIHFYYDAGFHRVYDRPVVINNFIILSHAPLEWVKAPMFNIFGHVHDNAIYSTWSLNGCCACVERHDYAPISWQTINTKYNELLDSLEQKRM